MELISITRIVSESWSWHFNFHINRKLRSFHPKKVCTHVGARGEKEKKHFLEKNLLSAPQIAEGRYTWLTSSLIIFVPIRFPFEEGNRKTGTTRTLLFICSFILEKTMCFDVQKLGNTQTDLNRWSWIGNKGPYREKIGGGEGGREGIISGF